MKHEEYRKFLKQLKYSGWILLGEAVVAISFVCWMILNYIIKHHLVLFLFLLIFIIKQKNYAKNK